MHPFTRTPLWVDTRAKNQHLSIGDRAWMDRLGKNWRLLIGSKVYLPRSLIFPAYNDIITLKNHIMRLFF